MVAIDFLVFQAGRVEKDLLLQATILGLLLKVGMKMMAALACTAATGNVVAEIALAQDLEDLTSGGLAKELTLGGLELYASKRALLNANFDHRVGALRAKLQASSRVLTSRWPQKLVDGRLR